MKVLIIQHKRIGDVLVSTILCENVKKAFPNSTVDYLINSNTLPVLENNPYIDHKIVFDTAKYSGIANFIKFAKEINRKNNYDVIIDVYSKIQSWIFVHYNKADKKISYKKTARTFLYSDNVVKHNDPYSYLGLAIEHRLALLKPLGIEKPLATEPKLYLTEKEIESAKDLFKHYKVNQSRKTVMISLIGSEPSKTYPLNEMKNIVDYIGENYNVNILFNYLPDQRQQAQLLYDQLTESTKQKVYFDLFANDLRQFISVLNECDVIVGNDGGAVNMAKALGKETFTIFSPKVEKKIWATFDDDIKNVSVHANDYFPEIFNDKKNKIKKMNKEIYSIFEFQLFTAKLKSFLDQYLN